MARRSDIRERILLAACHLFASNGFKGTSLHDIAAEVGASKASVLYHFDSKDAILVTLLQAAVEALTELDSRLDQHDGATRQSVAVEGLVDIAVRFRHEIGVLHGDILQLIRQPEFHHVQRVGERLLAALAGPEPTTSSRIAAQVLLAGFSGACVELSKVDEITDDELRSAFIDIAARTLGTAVPSRAARP